jgi:hypothetical protein
MNLKDIREYWALSPTGAAVGVISAWLLGNGLAHRNPYELIISLSGLLILGVLLAIGYRTAFRLGPEGLVWTEAKTVRAGPDSEGMITFPAPPVRMPRFFRYHLTLTGVLDIGNHARVRWRGEARTDGSSELRIPVHLPISGAFLLRACRSVHDVFGLVRVSAGKTAHRETAVLPARQTAPPRYDLKSHAGNRESATPQTAEEERYYMREYVPGDRIRDVNWKASSRLPFLLTRVSPESRKETPVIPVLFRPFTDTSRPSLDSILALEYLKGRMIAFLGSYLQNEKLEFTVQFPGGSVLLQSIEDLDALEREIGRLGMQRLYEPAAADRPDAAAVVFSTVFDPDLDPICNGAVCAVIVYPVPRGSRKQKHTLRTLRYVSSRNSWSLPGSWAFRTRFPERRVPTGADKTLVDYINPRLV